jgi:hypothetical protein
VKNHDQNENVFSDLEGSQGLVSVYDLHGGRSALGVDTRWAACACRLRVWLQSWAVCVDRHAGAQRTSEQPLYKLHP